VRLTVEYVPIERLRPDPFNPRRISAEEMESLTRSIREFGLVDPLVVRREDNTIIGGHQRLIAARRLGLETVPVVFVSLSEEQARLLNLALNRISGEWDEELLAQLFKELKVVNAEVTLSGFGEDEIAGFLKSLEKRERRYRVEAFDVEAALADAEKALPRTRLGDLYLLGPHRLLCGDSTNPQDVARLMDGEPARLVVTDPPYGVAYDPSRKGESGRKRRYSPIEGDDLEGEEFLAFLTAALTVAAHHTTEDASWYIWHASTTRPMFLQALAAAGIEIHQEIIWVKESFQLGRADYHWQHESCLYGWGEKHSFYGGRRQSTVWEVPRESGQLHPTTKPVEVFARPMRNNLQPDELALDMFLGSGTAIIAAEKEGVRCYGMEIDPHYCDVIVARWEAFTREKAGLEDKQI